MRKLNNKTQLYVFLTTVCLIGILLLSFTTYARAQDPFIGEIRMFAGNFAPRGWALCNGQLLQISSNQALFSILGTTYGGDGRTTFALPDLRSRFPLHPGTGPGLTGRNLGEKNGTETVTLTVNEMPNHTHGAVVHAYALEGNSATPTNNVMSKSGQGDPVYYSGSADTTLQSGSVEVLSTGGAQPHTNMPPFLGINFIIALEGIYPSRD